LVVHGSVTPFFAVSCKYCHGKMGGAGAQTKLKSRLSNG
jgi:hypothetical protein